MPLLKNKHIKRRLSKSKKRHFKKKKILKKKLKENPISVEINNFGTIENKKDGIRFYPKVKTAVNKDEHGDGVIFMRFTPNDDENSLKPKYEVLYSKSNQDINTLDKMRNDLDKTHIDKSKTADIQNENKSRTINVEFVGDINKMNNEYLHNDDKTVEINKTKNNVEDKSFHYKDRIINTDSTVENENAPKDQLEDISQTGNNTQATELLSQPFTVSDKINNKTIQINPKEYTPNEQGYIVYHDDETNVNYVIEPPKLTVFDPQLNKVLIIDPNTPIGKYNSIRKSNNDDNIIIDTSNLQPHYILDESSGAVILVDNDKMKPFNIIDPSTQKEIKIDRLYADGKQYTTIENDIMYSVIPIVPDSTPVMYKGSNNDFKIFGGPVKIKDKLTNNKIHCKEQFVMKHPDTNEIVKQNGIMLINDPITNEDRMINTPKYIKDKINNRIIMEPCIEYKIINGKLTTIINEEITKHNLDTNLTWDNKLKTFVNKKDIKKIEKIQNKESEVVFEKLTKKIIKNKSIDSILDHMYDKNTKKVIKTFLKKSLKNQNKIIKNLINLKKTHERKEVELLLNNKEEIQNEYINNLIDIFEEDIKYIDKSIVIKQIKDKINELKSELFKEIRNMLQYENNLVLDAILIQTDKIKENLFKICHVKNNKGVSHDTEDSNEMHDIKTRMSSEEFQKQNNSDEMFYISEILSKFKMKIINKLNAELLEENNMILNEVEMNLKKEEEQIKGRMDELYDEICCRKYRIVRNK